MTKVAIFPVSTATGHIVYHAMAGDKQSHGKTAGEALDALTTQIQEEEAGTLVIVQNLRPDRFFDADQQRRLAELMARWHAAGDAGTPLPMTEQVELDTLIAAEVRASTKRTVALLHELTQ